MPWQRVGGAVQREYGHEAGEDAERRPEILSVHRGVDDNWVRGPWRTWCGRETRVWMGGWDRNAEVERGKSVVLSGNVHTNSSAERLRVMREALCIV